MLNAGSNWLLLAQATQKAGETISKEPRTSGFLVFLMILAIFVVPFVLGSMLAKMLKLKDLSTKIGGILLAVTLGLAPFVWHLANGGELKDAIRLGIDLAGGTNLVFEVDHEKLEKKVTDEVMNQMVGVMSDE